MAKKAIYPDIVRGGIAIPIPNKTNYYYMKGKKHKDGGIDIGKNPRTGLEVEDGEVLHLTNNNIKVYSSVPFLNGKSPAEKVMGGENPNKVFKQQEDFKDRNNLNDDGTKAQMGKEKKITDNTFLGLNKDGWVEFGTSLIPIVGTVKDAKQFYDNPTKENFAWLAASALSEVPIFKWVKGAKIAKSAKIAADFAESSKKLAKVEKKLNTMKNTPNLNPNKIKSLTGEKGKLYRDNLVLKRQLNDARAKSYYFNNTKNVPIAAGAVVSDYAQGLKTTFTDNFDNILHKNNYNKKAMGGKINKPVTITANGKTKVVYSPSTGGTRSGAEGNRAKAKLGTDIIGLSSNLIGSGLSFLANRRMLKNFKDVPKPVSIQPTKLKTKININSSLDKMRETAAAYNKAVDSNTSSSRVALARKNKFTGEMLGQYNSLIGDKENREAALINQDILNRQTVAEKNITAYNNYLSKQNALENAIVEKRAENTIGLISNLNKGIQDYVTTKEKRKQFKNNLIAMSMAYPNVDVDELLEKLDL